MRAHGEHDHPRALQHPLARQGRSTRRPSRPGRSTSSSTTRRAARGAAGEQLCRRLPVVDPAACGSRACPARAARSRRARGRPPPPARRTCRGPCCPAPAGGEHAVAPGLLGLVQRRVGGAVERPRSAPSAGNWATPALKVTRNGSSIPSRRRARRAASPAASAIRCTPSSRSIPYIATTNSSPPQRATTSSARKERCSSRADAPQHLVAHAVPEAVVHPLEAVEVDHRQRERLPLPRRQARSAPSPPRTGAGWRPRSEGPCRPERGGAAPAPAGCGCASPAPDPRSACPRSRRRRRRTPSAPSRIAPGGEEYHRNPSSAGPVADGAAQLQPPTRGMSTSRIPSRSGLTSSSTSQSRVPSVMVVTARPSGSSSPFSAASTAGSSSTATTLMSLPRALVRGTALPHPSPAPLSSPSRGSRGRHAEPPLPDR